MKKTVLITGSSSGIGRATALEFAAKGWNVAATMRRPENEQELGNVKGIRLYSLDVLDEEGIQQTVSDVIRDFGAIDAVVNNAGYGLIGPFEAASQQQIRRQFETNLYGVMNVTRAVLPHFRARSKGTFLNVTSIGGRVTFPLYSLYHSTKWGLEGFSESLHYELRQFGIRIKIIEPGAIQTDFSGRSLDRISKEGLHAYDDYVNVFQQNAQKQAGSRSSTPDAVARVIYRAATDGRTKMRYAAAGGAKMILSLRKLPLSWFHRLVRNMMEKGFKPSQSVQKESAKEVQAMA